MGHPFFGGMPALSIPHYTALTTQIYPFDFRDFVWLENTNVIVANVGQVVLLVLSAMAQIILPFLTLLAKVLFLQVSICFYL